MSRRKASPYHIELNVIMKQSGDFHLDVSVIMKYAESTEPGSIDMRTFPHLLVCKHCNSVYGRPRLALREVARCIGCDAVLCPRSAGKPLMRIKLQVRRFDAWLGQRAQLEADWSLGLAEETGNSRLSCRGFFNAPPPGGYEQFVQAQQRLIDQLTSRIATDARAWASMHGAGCSADSGSEGW